MRAGRRRENNSEKNDPAVKKDVKDVEDGEDVKDVKDVKDVEDVKDVKDVKVFLYILYILSVFYCAIFSSSTICLAPPSFSMHQST